MIDLKCLNSYVRCYLVRASMFKPCMRHNYIHFKTTNMRSSCVYPFILCDRSTRSRGVKLDLREALLFKLVSKAGGGAQPNEYHSRNQFTPDNRKSRSLIDRPHTTRFWSCDGSDRIRYETTGHRRGS